MTEALPSALLVFVVIILVAMSFRRPDPNHQFILNLVSLLDEEQTSPVTCV